MKETRVLYMGTPDFAVPALRALADRHRIVGVLSQPPRPSGRGQKLQRSPVHRAADELGLPVRTPLTLRDPVELAALADWRPEVAVVAAYGLILPPPVLSLPRHGCLNIHASLLPRWRGAAPIHRAVMAGDGKTGISIMQMDEGLDTGAVLLHRAVAIGEDDTTGDVHDMLAELGRQMILAALDGLEFLPRDAQSRRGVTYAKKIDKAEARIDWSEPAPDLARRIRGLSPFPGAWAEVGGERVKFLRARALDVADVAPAPAGTILPGTDLTIACGPADRPGAIAVTLAQRAGRTAVSGAELRAGLADDARFS